MKTESKKREAVSTPVHVAPPPKESSGDKTFDEAIDKLLKKPAYTAPSK